MPRIPRSTIELFRAEFEKYLEGYCFQIKDISEDERIYIIEDSHIVIVSFLESSLSRALNKKTIEERENEFLCDWNEGDICYDMEIKELTYNEIGWKYNNADFVRKMNELTNIEFLGASIFFTKFRGFDRMYWSPNEESYVEKMDRLFPELQLRKRYELWDGKRYYFIIFEFDDSDGRNHFAVSYTMSSPSSYVNNMCKNYIKTGNFCNGNTRRNYSWDFENAIKSWKGVKRQKRLENHLRYCVVEKNTKEFEETWRYADYVLECAVNGEFDAIEKNYYLRPTNRWVTEEYVFKLTQKIYKDYKVIYQHRPFFLKSIIGGQMSYDIFISGLNVAIEYQGKQHFEPVAFFGGEAGYEDVVRRDREKQRLSEEKGIKLVYINYDEEVTPELIKERVEND